MARVPQFTRPAFDWPPSDRFGLSAAAGVRAGSYQYATHHRHPPPLLAERYQPIQVGFGRAPRGGLYGNNVERTVALAGDPPSKRELIGNEVIAMPGCSNDRDGNAYLVLAYCSSHRAGDLDVRRWNRKF
jgi:hypothetical protein